MGIQLQLNQVHMFRGGFDLKVMTVRGKTAWGLKEHRAGKHMHTMTNPSLVLFLVPEREQFTQNCSKPKQF